MENTTKYICIRNDRLIESVFCIAVKEELHTIRTMKFYYPHLSLL